MRQMFQDRARTCDFFDAHDFFLFVIACDFLARLTFTRAVLYMAMCLLIQECCCVIRLVSTKQIPSFLRIMSDYTLKRGGYFSR